MEKIFVRPVEGCMVPDPEKGDLLPPEGRFVTKNSWWARRRLDGDVVILNQDELKALSEKPSQVFLRLNPSAPQNPHQVLMIAQVNDFEESVKWEDYQTPKSIVLIEDQAEANRIGGHGSMLASMYSRIKENAPCKAIYALPVAFKSNQKNACANGEILIEGQAKEDGGLFLYVNSILVKADIVAGDTAETIGQKLEKALDEAFDIPVDRGARSKGLGAKSFSLFLMAKWCGESGNDIRLHLNVAGQPNNEFTPRGVKVSIRGMDHGVGQPDFEAIFNVIRNSHHQFIAFPWTTGFDNKDLLDAMRHRWSVDVQTFGHVFSAKRGTVGTLVSHSLKNPNPHRLLVGFERQSPHADWEYTAAVTGRAASYLSADPTRTIDVGTLKGLTPPFPAERFAMTDRHQMIPFNIASSYYEGGHLRIMTGRIQPHQLFTISYIVEKLLGAKVKVGEKNPEKVFNALLEAFLKLGREGVPLPSPNDHAAYFMKHFKVVSNEDGTFDLLGDPSEQECPPFDTILHRLHGLRKNYAHYI